MSVIDPSSVDPRTLIGKQRVGLLDSTGSYDVDRYAWAYEFWKRQQQTHWMGEEVPLGADLKDWASDRVTDNERARCSPRSSVSSLNRTSRSATTILSATSRFSSRSPSR
ncbi:hypothetical protein ACVIHI_008118 [Bradyrhizobium sp. USDA 4524]